MSTEEIDPALDPELDHVSRRSFLGKMSMGTVAAAVLGPAAAAQEKKDSLLKDDTLTHEDVTFQSRDTRVEGFLCRPKAEGKRGSVIVVQEIFGVNDHIREVACRVAKAGYVGLAVNYFTREGKPPDASGGFQPLMDFVGKIPDTQVMADTRAAVKYLTSRPESNGKVGIVGFCWGGRVAMLADANVEGIDAAVAYYGRIKSNATANQPQSPYDLAAKMKAPLLGHFGETDSGITPNVEPFREELKKAGKTAELHVYEGAGHAFNNDTRESYKPEAAKLAWRRTLEWFDKYLKG
jgi:carboxymethylenebutenolidase